MIDWSCFPEAREADVPFSTDLECRFYGEIVVRQWHSGQTVFYRNVPVVPLHDGKRYLNNWYIGGLPESVRKDAIDLGPVGDPVVLYGIDTADIRRPSTRFACMLARNADAEHVSELLSYLDEYPIERSYATGRLITENKVRELAKNMRRIVPASVRSQPVVDAIIAGSNTLKKAEDALLAQRETLRYMQDEFESAKENAFVLARLLAFENSV